MNMNSEEIMAVLTELEHVTRKIDTLSHELQEYKEVVQSYLRNYVIDRTYPLEGRFKVWSEYCSKIEWNVAAGSGDFGVIGKIISEDEFRQGTTTDWSDVIDSFEIATETGRYGDEDESGSGSGEGLYGIFLSLTVDDVREALISENFGSCLMEN